MVAVRGSLVSSIYMPWYFDLSTISEKPLVAVSEKDDIITSFMGTLFCELCLGRGALLWMVEKKV